MTPRSPGPRLEVFAHHRIPGFDLSGLRERARSAVAPCLGQPGPHPADLPALEVVEINLVSDPAIAAIHGEFMGVAAETDVITFPYGEVFVSLDTAAGRAAGFGHAPERETLLYIIHALLHLNGHHDHDPGEAAAMAKVQAAVLESLWPGG